MFSPTPFKHYLIAQDAGGNNIEVARSAEQVGVLAFDTHRRCFVHCHVLMHSLKNRHVFEERAALLADHGHALLARLIESGEDEGNAFYITEHVDGETLGDYLVRQEKLPLWLALRLTLQTVRALEACLKCGDCLPVVLPESLRVLQNGAQRVNVILSDYRLAEEAPAKAAKNRSVMSAFDKQAHYLGAFFEEQKQAGGLDVEATVSADSFAGKLCKMLASVGPDSLPALASFGEALELAMLPSLNAELAEPFRPMALLTEQLATPEELAGSVAQIAHIHRQKPHTTEAYTMRGIFLKTGQTVVLEQIPPLRLAGIHPSDAVHQVQVLLKAGQFPNLMPVAFALELEGIECLAERAVEGVTLNELLDERGKLGSQEVSLVFAALNVALSQLEKSGVATRRIRLEDIFLVVGNEKESLRANGLMKNKLQEWPGFSITLRTHPCLQGMTCRGTDPALLLPLNINAPADEEMPWHGGWMAALGSFLIGKPASKNTEQFFEDKQTESLAHLFEDEIERARQGVPNPRSLMLARVTRVMQQRDLATAPLRSAEVVREFAAALPPPAAIEKAEAGFAELLISGPSEEEHGLLGLRRLGSEVPVQTPLVESSWMSLRTEHPLWRRAIILFVASIALGAVLATLSGRALWQTKTPVAVEAQPNF